MPARWMLYCHDALGLGHVRRSLGIARSVLQRHHVAALLVTCSPVADALPMPAGLDYVKLPSARKVSNGNYVPRSLAIPAEELARLRSSVLAGITAHFHPDLLLVDKTPGGLMGELAPVLAHIDAERARTVLGVRDILDEPGQVQADWTAADFSSLVERHYDEIWIYGDPELFDACSAYRLPDELAERVRYLGYLVSPVCEQQRSAARSRFAEDRPLAVVTVGGGEDGEGLVRTYLEAQARGLLPSDLLSVVVLGPCMPLPIQEDLAARAQDPIRIESFVPELAAVIAAADVVISMAGYNTVCELMAGPTPAVLVPRTQPRKEQWIRARRMEERGLAECVDPERLDPVRLAQAVHRALRRGRPRGCFPDTEGLTRIAQEVSRLLPNGHTGNDGSRLEPAVGSRVGT